MTETRFQYGDRVMRRENVYDDSSKWMVGTVVGVYGTNRAWPWLNPPSYVRENIEFGNGTVETWRDPECYEVLWDDGVKRGGYFPHGLEPFDMDRFQRG